MVPIGTRRIQKGEQNGFAVRSRIVMRCNCEVAEIFGHAHEPGECKEQAFVKCAWIGGVCLTCASDLNDYLIPLSDLEFNYRFSDGLALALMQALETKSILVPDDDNCRACVQGVCDGHPIQEVYVS